VDQSSYFGHRAKCRVNCGRVRCHEIVMRRKHESPDHAIVTAANATPEERRSAPHSWTDNPPAKHASFS
jgi:hypothetical protein